MIASVLLAVALLQPPEPPRTVNSEILGSAEAFKTVGPALVCIGLTSIVVLPGETAYLDYLGIHWGGVRVTGLRGTFLVRDGDSWAESPRVLSYEDGQGRTVARVRRKGRTTYLIYRRSGSGEERPAIWIEGDALGRSRDASILDRIGDLPRQGKSCDRRFEYGWDFLLGPGR